MPPVPASRPRMRFDRRTRRTSAYYGEPYKSWKARGGKMMPGLCLEAGVGGLIDYPVLVVARFVATRPKKTKFEYPKPDIDNYLKALLDICNGTLWVDDRQVIATDATKEWSSPGETGFIEMQVERVRV